MTGEAFGILPATCVHDGAPLIVGTVEWFISFGAGKRDPFSTIVVEMAHQMKQQIGLQTVMRLCGICLCVTLEDGHHSEPLLKSRASH